MSQIQTASATIHPFCHITPILSPHTALNAHNGIDIDYYTQATYDLLDKFYPKECCNKQLLKTDGIRETILRCPECHKQQSKLKGTPLEHYKLPLWTFSYILHVSIKSYPCIATSAYIQRELCITYTTALKLKRRLQLFLSHLLESMKESFKALHIEAYNGFELPIDPEADLSEFSKTIPVPQADTLALYCVKSSANKGRKRYKHTGQTSSIYMSESLGGLQKGTLVNTLGMRNGPVFFDSISDQKISTITPILSQYISQTTPLFTDMGYRGYTGRNHRMINHSARSKDKRYYFARNRWSRKGVHNQVAEGNNGVLKTAFRSYRWISPRYSQLYLNEFAALRNLQHFDLKDLVGENGLNKYRGNKQRNPNLRGFDMVNCSKGDLNPHGISPTSTSSLRVYQFHHPSESVAVRTCY